MRVLQRAHGMRVRASKLERLLGAGACFLLLVLHAPAAWSQDVLATAGNTSESRPNPWRTLFERDLDYLVRVIPTHYIYAVHPGGAAWESLFQGSVAQARREATLIDDFSSYRAVLQHFVVSFEDAHFSAYFNVASRRSKWPRFAVEYQGGRYVVVESEHPDVQAGQTVSACDGEPLNAWMDRLAEYFGGPPGRVTTRAAIARQFFVDRGNPLYALPRACRIGDREITLTWVESPPEDRFAPERTSSSAPTIADESVSVSELGENGAWVRIGTMMAMTGETASQFRQLFDAAPTLRDKDVVVIDVRGNAGGMYNWFMAFLRAFYGQEYADYYARARLEIANTMLVLSPTGTDDPGFSAAFDRIEVPPDPPMEVPPSEPRVRQLPNGSRLVSTPAPIEFIAYPDQPPANPVRAQVYLLTDYGCASACLSFVDEMMRFPGVVQVGTETHVDRRSGGWPEKFELPSELAFVRMGRMVREGRRRGENEPWAPTYRFPGDITDTAAVRQWILEVVIPRKEL